MAINRGTGSIRRGAKNYIHAQAQSRLDEVVHPYQQIGENALKVDSLVALFYHVTKSSTVCSCKQVHDLPTSNADLSPVLEKPKSIVDHTVRLDLHRPLFGFGEQQTVEDEVEDVGKEGRG